MPITPSTPPLRDSFPEQTELPATAPQATSRSDRRRALLGVGTGNALDGHDLLDDHPVPSDTHFGIHALRAVQNFPITGTPISVYPT